MSFIKCNNKIYSNIFKISRIFVKYANFLKSMNLFKCWTFIEFFSWDWSAEKAVGWESEQHQKEIQAIKWNSCSNWHGEKKTGEWEEEGMKFIHITVYYKMHHL